MRHSFGIVGGGIVGLATAIAVRHAFPNSTVTLWEKESEVGRHQSTHNSGVLHAGLYYKPGSLKARLAVAGIRQMVAFCREHDVPHEICGKLVVATDEEEVRRLRSLMERGNANGLRGLRWLDPAAFSHIEPHARGLAALHVPEEGIVDYEAVIAAMVRVLKNSEVTIHTNSEVLRLTALTGGWDIMTANHSGTCTFLVTCAGLHSDRLAALAGERQTSRIVPFRGEYYRLTPRATGLVRNLIYPVPDPVFPFLGVHFTRLIHGGIEAGPNAVLAFAREGYRRVSFNPADAIDTIFFKGLWRFLRKHRRMCWDEFRRSWSRRLFCDALRRLVPDLCEDDLSSGGAGVRAQAMSHNGELVQDFELIERPKALHVVNAPSPGATASLAIGQHIASRIKATLSS